MPAVATIEPGLEEVVTWPWKVEPSAGANWGNTAAPTAPDLKQTESSGTPAQPPAPIIKTPEKALDHTVVRGESLTVIARQYAVSIAQIKTFNELKSDIIRVGQVLRIPGVEDIKAMTPVTPAADPAKPATAPAPGPPVLISTKPRRALPPSAWRASALVQTQAFLDRQGFTVGPIDGASGAIYMAAYAAFDKAKPGVLFAPDGSPSAEMLAMGGPYTEYVLRAGDLDWISASGQPSTSARGKNSPVDPPLKLTDLTQGAILKYRSAWEFVAERFHASETFLRSINPHIKSAETPGATFLVPNVVPFEIENAFADPVQPVADPTAPVHATIVKLRRLVIRRGDTVVASMPISVARPGLSGRGTWKILDATARAQMSSPGPATSPAPAPVTLPAGPNNPVGIAWINLAKATNPTPLPYGLHGTSIPGHMTKLESIGGFRLANWDLARALRLLPSGTDLTWE